MNIFSNKETFFGDIPINRLADAYREFFTLAGDIRTRLGDKAYLLDTYLSQLLNVTDKIFSSDELENSADYIPSLYAICRASCHSDQSIAHPFFAEARNYILAHPMVSQEPETQTCLYFSILINGYIESSIKACRQPFFEELTADFYKFELDHCYDAICRQLGDDEPMKQLNLLFQERFLAVSATAVFYRNINNQLAEALSYRDAETSLQIFQLLLNNHLLNDK